MQLLPDGLDFASPIDSNQFLLRKCDGARQKSKRAIAGNSELRQSILWKECDPFQDCHRSAGNFKTSQIKWCGKDGFASRKDQIAGG